MCCKVKRFITIHWLTVYQYLPFVNNCIEKVEGVCFRLLQTSRKKEIDLLLTDLLFCLNISNSELYHLKLSAEAD